MGYVNVDRMLSEIDSRQLTEWEAYLRIADSAHNPEPTPWDSHATKQRKLDLKAARKAKR